MISEKGRGIKEKEEEKAEDDDDEERRVSKYGCYILVGACKGWHTGKGLVRDIRSCLRKNVTK